MPATASSGGRRTAGAAKNFTREDLDLARDLSAFYADPLGFVLYVFPWGKKGTRLADEAGPDAGVLIAGSVYGAGEARTLLRPHGEEATS